MRLFAIVLFLMLFICIPAYAGTAPSFLPKSETEIQVSGRIGLSDGGNSFILLADDTKNTQYVVDIGPLWFHELELVQDDIVTVVGSLSGDILYASTILRPDESIVRIINPQEPEPLSTTQRSDSAEMNVAQDNTKSQEAEGVTPTVREPDFQIIPRKKKMPRLRTKFAEDGNLDDVSKELATEETDQDDEDIPDPALLAKLKDLAVSAGKEENKDLTDQEKKDLLDWFTYGRSGGQAIKPKPLDSQPVTPSPQMPSLKDVVKPHSSIQKEEGLKSSLKELPDYRVQEDKPRSQSSSQLSYDQNLSDFLPPVRKHLSTNKDYNDQKVAEKTPVKPNWDQPIDFNYLDAPPNINKSAKTKKAARLEVDHSNTQSVQNVDSMAVQKVMNKAIDDQNAKEMSPEDLKAAIDQEEAITGPAERKEKLDSISESLNKLDHRLLKDPVEKKKSDLVNNELESTRPTLSDSRTSDLLSIIDQKSSGPRWVGAPMNQSKVYVKVPEKELPKSEAVNTDNKDSKHVDSFFANTSQAGDDDSFEYHQPDFSKISQ